MITIAGSIGSGKTTLTTLLARHLGSRAFHEPVEDNPIIDDFYRGNRIAAQRRAAGEPDAHNPYAFLMQVYLLNRRFATIKQAMRDDDNVLDRSIYEDRIFMRMNYDQGNATKVEWQTYQDLFANMMEELPYAAHKKSPDLMVFIRARYETLIARIAKRGRPYEQVEQDPGLEHYYRELIRYYDDWARHYDASRLLVVDADRYDFEQSADDRAEVLAMIDAALAETRRS